MRKYFRFHCFAMNQVLPNQTFIALNKENHLSEIFSLSQGIGTLYVSTHFEMGNSNLLHYHDEPHLTFILNGGVTDKRKNLETERFSSELMFFHAGEPHQTISRSFPTKYVSFQFETNYHKKNPNLEAELQASVKSNPNAKLSMLKIYKELKKKDEFTESSVEMLLLGLLNGKNLDSNSRPNWLNKIVEILNDNWNEEISLGELAFAAGVHPKTISKYFPKYFSCTLGEYRRRIKIEKSLTLIKKSNFSLTEIALNCGFYDQSHFTETFKQMTGFLPKQFRKM